jgi:hypothetical protein
MIDFDALKSAGISVRKFCGLDESDGVGCSGEAVGDIIAQLEDDVQVPVPVCQEHLEMIMSDYKVVDISNDPLL